MYKSYFIVIALLFNGINGVLAEKKIVNIKCIYGLEGTLLPISAKCSPESFNQSFGDEMNFLITYDLLFIERFSELFENIKPNKDIGLIDPRIMCVVNYANNNIPSDTICFGETSGLVLNGIFMQDNIELLNLVKNKIGWKNKIDESTILGSKIKELKQLFSDELLFRAINHIAVELSPDSISFGDFFFQDIDNQFYKIQKSKDGLVLINRIRIWCESYILISAYMCDPCTIKKILPEIPQVKNIVDSLNDYPYRESKIELQELLSKITDYISGLSTNERIRFIECVSKRAQDVLRE